MLIIIALIIHFIWWILGGLVIVAGFFIIRAVLRQHRAAVAARERVHAEISARADKQHAWVLRGDARGICGPARAKLMHHVNGAVREKITRYGPRS